MGAAVIYNRYTRLPMLLQIFLSSWVIAYYKTPLPSSSFSLSDDCAGDGSESDEAEFIATGMYQGLSKDSEFFHALDATDLKPKTETKTEAMQ